MRSGEQLSMESGMIEMAFRETGVHIIATAPLSLTANGPNRISLHDGEAKLHVPPQGATDVGRRPGEREGTGFGVLQREKIADELRKMLLERGRIAVEPLRDVPRCRR